MAPTDDTAHRSLRYRAGGDDIQVREADEIDDEDGVFEVRMPIASTGEVRNEGDDPLTRAELEGFARQINERSVPVFPGHGSDSTIAAGRYSPFERLGDWRDGEFTSRSADGDDGVLMATARMPDPESLPQATGQYREGLAILKEQAKRGLAQDASIGWRGDETFPGGNDLMEASIVGIGADWRTNTDDEAAEVVAREAVAAGADPDDLIERVERAVRAPEPDDGRPFGPPGGDADKWDDFDACVADVEEWDDIDDPEAFCAWAEDQTKSDARAEYEVGDETVVIAPPDYMVNAADMAMQKSDAGLGSDCGTGVGDDRAAQIRNDEVGPDVVEEVAAYLTSHAEDVTADGTPDEWSDEEWDDCGNMQYAKWGGLGTGTALDWAQARANAVADARDEDLPYPDRAADADADGTTVTDDTDAAESDPPDGGTTETEQDAGDGETRAPDDLTEDRLATFTATHYDGLDESDLMEAADAADAEFVGTTDVEELFDLVSVVTGAEYDTVADAMGDLMEDAGEQEGDKPDDYDDEEDDEDGEMDADDPDDTQDAPGEKALDAVNELKEQFEEFRESGATETPDRGVADDEAESDDETEADRAADDPDTDGPNWRA